MKAVYGIFLVTLLVAFDSVAQEPSSIAGAYQWCPFPCITIRINKEFTFDYLVDGDLYNEARSRGSWEFTGAKEIRLRTPEHKLEIEVLERKDGPEGGSIRIETIDSPGATYPGVTVLGSLNGEQKTCFTNENGICDLPSVREITFQTLTRKVLYKIKDKRTNHLIVRVSSDFDPVIDQRFRLIRSGALCALSDGSNELGDCYVRLSKRRAALLFE